MSARTKEPSPSAAAPAGATRRLALGSPSAIAVFLLIAAAGLCADLASKHYVFESLLSRPGLAQDVQRIRHADPNWTTRDVLQHLGLHRDVMPGVRFTLSTNPSVAFGGLGLQIPRMLVSAATIITMLLVLYFFATSDPRAYAVQTALAFILAGALGNLYDRLFSQVALPGMDPICNQVRDFIDCNALYYPYVFNVADVLLVVGVILLLGYWWIQGKKQAKTAGNRQQAAGNRE